MTPESVGRSRRSRSGSAPVLAGAGVAVAFALTACSGPPDPIPFDTEAHRAEVQRFHDARVAELQAPDSWLSLIGLYWLQDG